MQPIPRSITSFPQHHKLASLVLQPVRYLLFPLDPLTRSVLAGAEPNAIETAPSFPKVTGAYPLSKPNAADQPAEQFDVMKYWANLAPMYSVDSFGLPSASPIVPKGCSIKQVFLLVRHGARYPTSGSGASQFASNIHAAATKHGFSVTGPLEFLSTWTYKLGAEILTPFGRQAL